ncbi:MAG: glycosyltransferase [Caldilineaceae bacterium]|nr:glycosyltransferase [Caldilineaceae bacterium]
MTSEKRKLVSIVIPCHNGEAYIERAICSVLNQTYPAIEVVVIDDGSTDGSLNLIRSFGAHVRWERGPNRGAPTARNRGLELARGEYIKFLDADDMLLPDCLERQVAQAQALEGGRKAIVYGDAIWVDTHGKPLPGYGHRPRRSGEDPIAHILENSPLTSCPLHRRDYLLEIGGFDPAIPKGQEQDLHLRLVLAGAEFVHYPGPVYCYREHQAPGRISNRLLGQNRPLVFYEVLRGQIASIEKQTGQPLSPAVRRVIARRFWAYGRAILREGHVPEADQYFAAARELDARHCVVGNRPYPLLVGVFGPHLAEALLRKSRDLRRLLAA